MAECPKCGYILKPFETECPRCDRQEKGFSPSASGDTFLPCPNCRQPMEIGRQTCPNCGFFLPAVWPPTPEEMPSPPTAPVSKLLTGNKVGDFVLGIVISIASFFVMCLGMFVMPILYLVFRQTYPAFARGLGWGWLVVVLGAPPSASAPLFGSSGSGTDSKMR